MKKFFSFCLVLIGLVTLTACGGNATNNGGGNADGNIGTLEVSGSTSVAPLMQKLASYYDEETGNLVNVSSDGSSAGIRAATEGVSQIGMSSRELEDDEKANLTEYVLALDAIGVIVNTQNPVSNLTTEQLTKIYSGEITNWNEVGGNDMPITVVTREDGSGTRTAWEEALELLNEDGTSKVAGFAGLITGNSTGAIIENVGQQAGAIGYVSIESALNQDAIHLINVNDIEATEETIVNGTYPISRPFILVYNAENANAPEVTTFLDWIKTDAGQAHIREAGYIPGSAANN
jgi:phosphate transport system substrate-binding protein